MDSAEFTDWMAYDRIDPFGEFRGDLRMGIAVSAYANSIQSDERFAPKDFMPFLEESDEGQSVDDQIRVMQLVAVAQNAMAEN